MQMTSAWREETRGFSSRSVTHVLRAPRPGPMDFAVEEGEEQRSPKSRPTAPRRPRSARGRKIPEEEETA